MKKKKIVHKRIKEWYEDRRYWAMWEYRILALCNGKQYSSQDKKLAYHWKGVTCKKCLKLKK